MLITILLFFLGIGYLIGELGKSIVDKTFSNEDLKDANTSDYTNLIDKSTHFHIYIHNHSKKSVDSLSSSKTYDIDYTEVEI